MTRTDVEQTYFEWMYLLICKNRYAKNNSYTKLLSYLHETEFRYIIKMDANRAEEGEELRYRFAYEHYSGDDIDSAIDYLSRPCSVLEMMIALAIKCEEIMDDPKIGDRTAQWFWQMIVNLGLGSMYDLLFDEVYVYKILTTFMKNEYKSDGSGGLFKIRDCEEDLRKVDIWSQMLWYLDSIII